MPRQRRAQPFLKIIVDHDNKVFNIVGPITDDTDWIKKIVELQKAGRDARCFTSHSIESIGNVADSYSKQTGDTFSHVLITDEPEDSSLEYKGALPNYAQSADRKRVVKILCKGKCGTTRWAEMNVDYPGQEVLRNSDLGDFTATCLKCGQVAKDSYNWFR